MKKQFLSALCFVVCCMVAGHSGWAQGIEWQTDLEAAKAKAAKENKLVLLHFWGENCGPCLRLENFVFPSPIVAKAVMETVIPVKIQDSKQPDLFAQFGIQRIPQDVAITPSGQVVMKRMSPTNTDGYLYVVSRLAEINRVLASKHGQELLAKSKSGSTSETSETTRLKPTILDDIGQFQQRDVELRRQKMANRPSGYSPQQSNEFSPVTHQDGTSGANINNLHVELPSHQAPTHQAPTHQAPVHQAPTHVMPQPSHQFRSQDRIANDESSESNLNPLRPMATAPKLVTNQFVQNANDATMETSVPSQVAADLSQGTNGLKQPGEIKLLAESNAEQEAISQTPIAQTPDAAMEGYCCVTILEDKKWVAGSKDWGCFHRGKLFLFENVAKRDKFMSSPDTYCPVLVGFDPVEFYENGRLVEGSINTGVFVDYDGHKQMVLFVSDKSKDEFDSEPKKYLNAVHTAMAPQQKTNGSNSSIIR